ncbi:hypothetical protein [Vallitalea okinawensis]|uniref:hypothetical protein n=1 Tax=Vallitalea okinawensis TaxID=2078660 RepID=UPI000CFA8C2B|nr:hypothetical protein [Vallitalea okinawensis]
MHTEQSRRKRASLLEVVVTTGVLFIIILLLNMLFYNMGIRGVFSDLLTICLPIVLGFYVLRSYGLSYQYTIICEELIIKECRGNKERVLLNININQIEEIHKGPISREEKKAFMQNKRFVDAKKHQNGVSYYCIYSEDGSKYCFQFEPSEKLLEKLKVNL